MAKTASKSFSLKHSSLKQWKQPFFPVLMYSLYGHHRKFNRKYQQNNPCFQTIFPFLMTMQTWKFQQVGIIVLMEVARHVKSTQNSKLAIFLPYLKKNIDLVYFLHAEKYESSYKVMLTFWVHLARPSQSTFNFSVWLGITQQKVAILN